MSNRRRFLIIFFSLLAGTFLSGLLMWSRKDQLSTNDYATLFINMLMAGAVIVGVGYILRKKENKF